MRSLLSLKLWSTRAVHWRPSRGSVWANEPRSVTGKSQGRLPIGVSIGAEPAQSEPSRPPAVDATRFVSGTNVSVNSFMTMLLMLLG